MKIWERFKKPKERRTAQVAFLASDEAYEILCNGKYMRLDRNPEIVAACRKIADLISSMTIWLMNNGDRGDERIINALSAKVDIDPMHTMTRKTWMDGIVMNMLLYGKGNAVVLPHTSAGYLEDLEPIPAGLVSFLPVGFSEYRILINGASYDPEDVLHFVHNPDKHELWRGQGVTLALSDVAEILAQAKTTEKAFMSSKWKPSVIVKVDALTEEFSNPEGRQKLKADYLDSADAGEPWIIPGEQFNVEQVRPLSLSDLAINETVTLDKRTVAALLGVPPFVLGVGEYTQPSWNSFVSSTIRPICREIEQELTRKLILSPKWYFRFNMQSLYDYSMQQVANVYESLYERGIVTGNEVRDRLGLSPMDGLDELHILENYIPLDMVGNQKKLNGGDYE